MNTTSVMNIGPRNCPQRDFGELDVRRRAALAVCNYILERHCGCYTPLEELVWQLITDVQLGMWPTPARVAGYAEEFRQNFEDMDRDARLFVETYPVKPEAKQTDAA